DLVGTFEPGAFEARLVGLNGARVAQGRDFGEDGTVRSESLVVLDEAAVGALVDALEDAEFRVGSVEEKPYRRKPAAPFRTSTLQQEASRKLRFSAQTTMRLAQRLYENGHITYMRTDSVNLSESALTAARAHATKTYGAETVPAKPRRYQRAVANAQEAHEAIRPAGDAFRAPAELRQELARDELALYDLIFKRTISSQMNDAEGQTVVIELEGSTKTGGEAVFRASGTVITSPGFLLAYESGHDEPEGDDEERRLPALTVGQTLSARTLEPQGHETTPPARFTEASLVRALEERGIGRPSTYASIMGTILDRGYVFKKGTALVPTFLAFSVTRLLEDHFGQLVDYDFTARLETDLDRIAAGREARIDWLRSFYFGNGGPGLHALVTDQLDAIDARLVNSIPIPGSDIVVRVGRFGPYLERGDLRASIPDDIAPDELTPAKAEELLSQPAGERSLGRHPETGREIAVRDGRYGPYVTEVLAEGEEDKPRTASLFSSMSLDSVTLDDAVRLLTLPRTLIGAGGEEILVSNGRYGPYVKKGSETRSLASEEQLLTVTAGEAEALLAQPKVRRGRGAAKPPLREIGTDPGNGRQVVVKDGRFGPYVTDGETNASLRKGDTVEALTPERAFELLAERRAKSA
ncbi:MAG TPA: DNA topoisomerase, partial [Gaiellaceae bacterium]|nr:DNA topoisomerase [Gaiellaceae bacterium]